MISVYYTPLGTPVSDFEAESTVDNIIEIYKNKSSHKDENNEKTYKLPFLIPDEFGEDGNYYIDVYTCNEIILLSFSLRILEGKIGVDDVTFYWDNNNNFIKLGFDENLGIELPEGVRDEDFSPRFRILEDSLKISHKKVKERIAERCRRNI